MNNELLQEFFTQENEFDVQNITTYTYTKNGKGGTDDDGTKDDSNASINPF